MYILLIYADPNKQCLVFYGYFDRIKDIIHYTNGVLRYSDIKNKRRCYITYKSFFDVVKYTPKLYFKVHRK
jgi:hypothetical protein